MKTYDLAIIGAGVTGLSAGMYAGRLGLNTVVFGAASEFEEAIGGVITTTDIVENYPGFKKLTGTELAEKIRDHALDYEEHVEIKQEKITDLIKHNEDFHCFELKNQAGETYHANAVLIATGTKWRRLPMPGAKEFESRGVSYCALCDGPLFKNKNVIVVGGSDSAAKEALFLSKHAAHVTIMARGEQIRPEPVNQKLIDKTDNITVETQVNIQEIRGNQLVTEVELDREINGSTTMPIDGVFGAIGHIPLSDLAANIGVELDEANHIKINRLSETNIKGVYAAGDVVDTDFKQAIIGVAEGVTAAYNAFKFIQANDFVCEADNSKFA